MKFTDAFQPEPVQTRGTVSPEEVCRQRCREVLLWERYLYEDHTRKQIGAWARRLKHFRFARAYGGHANDGDQLIVMLRTGDEDAMLAICRALGLVLQPMPSAPELQKLSAAELPLSCRHYPGWQQPGHTSVAGSRLYAWLGSYLVKDESGRLTGEAIPSLQLSVMDEEDVWSVTEAAVAHAEAVESLLTPLAAQLIDPPQDDRNCISPKRYPEMFGLWHRATAEWPWREPDPH